MSDFHQCMTHPDGSVTARPTAASKWRVINTTERPKDPNTQAARFAKVQNKYWKPWMIDAARRHKAGPGKPSVCVTESESGSEGGE